MAISGETIDYGPCAFMEAYDPDDGVQLHRPPGPLRLRQPARHRGLEPGAAGRDAAAADRRRRRARPWRWPARSSPPSRRSTAATCCADSAPSSDCAAANRTTTSPMPRWPRTGWPCCTPSAWTSRSGGDGLPMPPPATKRRCARCSPTRVRPTPGSSAGAHVAPARTAARVPTAAMAGSARAAAMRRVSPDVIPAQPPRGRGAGRGVRRWRPGAVRAPARRPQRSRTTRPPSWRRYAEPAPAAVTACYRTFCGT